MGLTDCPGIEFTIGPFMHLVFDARHLHLQYSGLARYSASLVDAILQLPDTERPDRCTVLITPEVQSSSIYGTLLDEIENCLGFEVRVIDQSPFASPMQTKVVAALRELKAHHYIYPHFDVPIGIGTPTTFVIHDVMPILVQGYILKYTWLKKPYFYLRTLASLTQAEHCIAVSENTRSDLLRLFGSRFSAKTTVIYAGIPALVETEPTRLTKSDYLLYVGDRRPHKNIERMLEIFRVLITEHGYAGKLIISGPKTNFGFDPEAYAQTNGLPIEFPGPVPDGVLDALYRNASAHVLISKYEGFGLPVIEAARHSTKTIVSDQGALPEIAPAGALVLPNTLSVQEAAGRVNAYLASADHPDGAVISREFQWSRTARLLMDRIRTPVAARA